MMYAAGQVPVCRIARNFAVFLACALYGVHPLRVEPYTLAGVFLAGALNCHVTSRLALTHAHAKRQKEDWCGVRAFFWAQDAVVLFACACLSKAAALPAVVCLPLSLAPSRRTWCFLRCVKTWHSLAHFQGKMYYCR
eukprot:1196203-Prorocentrum_minimum.AAC.3